MTPNELREACEASGAEIRVDGWGIECAHWKDDDGNEWSMPLMHFALPAYVASTLVERVAKVPGGYGDYCFLFGGPASIAMATDPERIRATMPVLKKARR